MPRWWWALVVAVSMFLISSFAYGADFTINPVKINLSANIPSQILTLHNTSTETLRFQLNVFSWNGTNDDGTMVLAETTDVVFFPRMLVIPPGQTRIVRIGTRPPLDREEHRYRVLLEELPPPVEQQRAGVVLVRLRLSIPIHVAPVAR